MIYDTIIIGSGPAGLSASLYTARANLSTLIITKAPIGGLLTNTAHIDNYLGFTGNANDLIEKFAQHVKDFGVTISENEVTKITKNEEEIFTIETLSGEMFYSRTVIYAGGSTPRKLGLENEEKENVSYCATCDGIFYTGDTVAVVGGGESAVEDALYLANMCDTVHVFVRSHWRAAKSAIDKIENTDNIIVHMKENISALNITDDLVTSITTTSGNTIDVDGIFVAIGQNPQTEIIEDLVSLDIEKFVRESKTAGFFVAGDLTNPEHRQVAVAVGSGAIAGIEATKFLLN